VTLPMIARELKLSGPGAAQLLGRLGSVPREVTGRRRYRAWTV
jgi:hypothetical protein